MAMTRVILPLHRLVEEDCALGLRSIRDGAHQARSQQYLDLDSFLSGIANTWATATDSTFYSAFCDTQCSTKGDILHC